MIGAQDAPKHAIAPLYSRLVTLYVDPTRGIDPSALRADTRDLIPAAKAVPSGAALVILGV